MDVKQVIVVNRALNMPPGKLAVQVAHASMGALLKSSFQFDGILGIYIPRESAIKQWLEEKFTKIVVYVKSEEKLLNIYKIANEKGLQCVLIQDAGLTFFDKPTYTCVGVGPAFVDNFIGITDKLQLLD